MLKKLLKDKLVAKYPGVLKKLTPKGQELLVDKLASKVTSEDEVEDFVNGLEDTIDIFVDVVVSESDRRVREAGKKPQNGTETPEDDNKDGNGNKPGQPDEVPAWAKGLVQSVESLQQQLAQEKGNNRQDKLIAAAKLKGIPEKLARKYNIGDDYNEDAALTELESDWNELRQFDANSGAGNGRIPAGQGTGGSKEVSSAITNFAKANVAAAEKTAGK